MAQTFKIDGGDTEESHKQDAPAAATPGQPAAPAAQAPTPASPTPAPATPAQPATPAPTPAPAPAASTESALPHAGAPVTGAKKESTDDEEEEKGESKTLFWIIVAILFILIAVVGGGTLYARNQGTTLMGLFQGEGEETETEGTETPEGTEGEETENSTEGEETDTESAGTGSTTYTGSNVTATLPEGWSVVEYVDGDGSDMLVDGVTYTGLTGLEVLTSDDTVAYSMNAVNGIGGIEACSEYYEFPDNSLSYYQQIASEASEVGITPSIVEVADGSYTEFTLFDLRVRRGGYTLYWDRSSDDDTSFDAACGMSARIFIFEDLTFGADGTAHGNYQFEVNNSLNETDLPTLDSVLDSLAVVE